MQVVFESIYLPVFTESHLLIELNLSRAQQSTSLFFNNSPESFLDLPYTVSDRLHDHEQRHMSSTKTQQSGIKIKNSEAVRRSSESIPLTCRQRLQSIRLYEYFGNKGCVAVIHFLLELKLRSLNILSMKESEGLGAAITSLENKDRTM